MGKYNKAENIYSDVLEIYENIYDKSHPEYATLLHNIGELYRGYSCAGGL